MMQSVRIKTILLVFFLANITAVKADMAEQNYNDFSSDRSTWFFNVSAKDNKTVFADFFSPFDPTVKTNIYDPLIRYDLEQPYYINSGNRLMMSLEDLRKLYAPYFDYEINDDKLRILHTVYDKKILSGVGNRSTTLQYTQKEWLIDIDLANLAESHVKYTEYESATGGRNRPVTFTEKITKSTKGPVLLTDADVTLKQGHYFVAASQLMKSMGKSVFINEGYLHIQNRFMADVTVATEHTNSVGFSTPNSANPWHGGLYEKITADYSWADYMNSIINKDRKSGWMWQSFFIPSGEHFVDKDGKSVALQADRIVPFNLYVPTNYSSRRSRMLFMLHGGTGNENTATYRIMRRATPIAIDEYAEQYNYVLVSPNGWTQNPMWREHQAFYSFNQAAMQAMEHFPVSEDKVFITGNSMGGKGTLEMAMRKPDMFRAMAPTAVKIVNRNRSTKETWINIEESEAYDLSNIKDMPAFIVQGNADSTTSFKTQIGNKEAPGAIVRAVMPKLDNATYVTVEEGDHSHGYGVLLGPIFEFFESTLNNPVKLEYPELNFENASAKINEKDVELLTLETVEQTNMIALSELKQLLGDGFEVYKVHSYNKQPEKAVDYYTIIFNQQSVNLFVNSKAYRKNMERYKLDADIMGAAKNVDGDLLDVHPEFSVAPFEKNNDVFVPAAELLTALGKPE